MGDRCSVRLTPESLLSVSSLNLMSWLSFFLMSFASSLVERQRERRHGSRHLALIWCQDVRSYGRRFPRKRTLVHGQSSAGVLFPTCRHSKKERGSADRWPGTMVLNSRRQGEVRIVSAAVEHCSWEKRMC